MQVLHLIKERQIGQEKKRWQIKFTIGQATSKLLGESEDGGINIKGSASTNGLDRAGDIIETDAWTKGGLESFKNNPIILSNHDYDRAYWQSNRFTSHMTKAYRYYCKDIKSR